jgi:hypothetical protein
VLARCGPANEGVRCPLTAINPPGLGAARGWRDREARVRLSRHDRLDLETPRDDGMKTSARKPRRNARRSWNYARGGRERFAGDPLDDRRRAPPVPASPLTWSIGGPRGTSKLGFSRQRSARCRARTLACCPLLLIPPGSPARRAASRTRTPNATSTPAAAPSAGEREVSVARAATLCGLLTSSTATHR